MTEIDEFLEFRKELLKDSSDEHGFIQESEVLARVTPSMLDSKLVESEDPNPAYHESSTDNCKLNAYSISESGERLQLYIVDERQLIDSAKDDTLLISLRADYEKQFTRATKLIKRIIASNEPAQDSSPILPLLSKLTSAEGIDQFDVIDIFLISLTATVQRQGGVCHPKSIHFDDNNISAVIVENGEKRKKDLLVIRKVIDLNFLYNVEVSKGNREPLVVNFEKTFGAGLPAIQAAEEQKFESYLCVLPANILAELYKRYSTRLLEKNVRSFLQFTRGGVNSGLRKTIREEPEKFIAYNNGLTITATSTTLKNKRGQIHINSLTDFQIVNGGQTTATIYFSKKDGIDISKVKVMAKINVAKETTEAELDDLIGNISEFSNAQSRVSKVDLRSRNPQLIQLKKLSSSVMPPIGEAWFFERSKGEYQTMLRLKGKNKSVIKKRFPTKRRFTKELLAKYYSAWGDEPYLVKKGGEKIFRYFIEEVNGDGEGKKPLNIDRDFYEDVISRILLFRNMETIHGSGKKALGQLRSAVIPYAMSVLYAQTDGLEVKRNFRFDKIWKKQGLEDDLSVYLEELMTLMYIAIKKTKILG